MIKSFLIFITLLSLELYSRQIILVVSDDFNTSHAKLSFYDKKQKLIHNADVNIGKKGLGWGLGILEIPHSPNEPLKHEGDKKAPAGIFQLSALFAPIPLHTSLPFIKVDKNVICVDDSTSPFYNTIIQKPTNPPKSYENMLREDGQYALGIVVAHNVQQKKGMGSCIFLHVEKKPHSPTAGCTSMPKKLLQKIISLLDVHKNPLLIQVPKRYLPEVYALFPDLQTKSSKRGQDRNL